MRAATARGTAALLLAIGLPASEALAHGTIKAGDFYSGLVQPVFHPESLLALLALLLWSTQLAEPQGYLVPFVFCAAALAGCASAWLASDLPAVAWVERGATLVLGLLVAARWSLPRAAALALAVALGLATGHEAMAPELAALQRPWLYALGLGAAVLVLWGYLTSLTQRFRAHWAQVAVRIGGSWIATVTLLVSALALARR